MGWISSIPPTLGAFAEASCGVLTITGLGRILVHTLCPSIASPPRRPEWRRWPGWRWVPCCCVPDVHPPLASAPPCFCSNLKQLFAPKSRSWCSGPAVACWRGASGPTLCTYVDCGPVRSSRSVLEGGRFRYGQPRSHEEGCRPSFLVSMGGRAQERAESDGARGWGCRCVLSILALGTSGRGCSCRVRA